MQVQPFDATPLNPMPMDGAVGCQVRWLLGPDQGAPTFAMRQFEVAPGGYTPLHSHPFEHEIYILAGEGVVLEGATEHPLRPGVVILVVPNELHQFRNTGSEPLKFLCLIPNSAMYAAMPVAPECGR